MASWCETGRNETIKNLETTAMDRDIRNTEESFIPGPGPTKCCSTNDDDYDDDDDFFPRNNQWLP